MWYGSIKEKRAWVACFLNKQFVRRTTENGHNGTTLGPTTRGRNQDNTACRQRYTGETPQVNGCYHKIKLYTYLPLLDKLRVDKGPVHGVDIQIVTRLGLLLVLVVEAKLLAKLGQGTSRDILDGSTRNALDIGLVAIARQNDRLLPKEDELDVLQTSMIQEGMSTLDGDTIVASCHDDTNSGYPE